MCQSLPGKSLNVRDSRKSAGVMKNCPSTSMEANCSNLVFRLVCEWTCTWSAADLARTTLTDEFLVWLLHNKQQPTPPIPTSVTRNKDVFPAKDENIAQGKECADNRKLWKTREWISCIEIITNLHQTSKSRSSRHWQVKDWAREKTAEQTAIFHSSVLHFTKYSSTAAVNFL